MRQKKQNNMASESPYLIVHDGSETKDADMDIILLAHQAGVLQGSAPRKSAIPGEGGLLLKGPGELTVPQMAGCPSAAAAAKGDGGHCTNSPEREGAEAGCSAGFTFLEQTFVSNHPGSQLYNQG